MAENKFIREFLNHIKVEKNYSAHTIRSYQQDLNRMKEFFDRYDGESSLDKLDKSAVQFFLADISKSGITATSLSRKIATVKSFYRFMIEFGYVKSNVTHGIAFPKIPKKLPRILNEKEMKLLLSSPDLKTTEGIRDRMMMEILYSSGMRISELITIRLKNIRLEQGQIKVMGKGKRERQVLLGTKAIKYLKLFLSIRNDLLYSNSIYLIPKLRKNHSGKSHISIKKVYNILKKYLNQFNDDIISPHSIRHSTATHMLERGADLMSVKETLGHENIISTQVYTHVQKKYMEKVYKQAHPHGN